MQMGQKSKQKIHWSEITPEHVYVNRRKFMQAGALGVGALALGLLGDRVPETRPLGSH